MGGRGSGSGFGGGTSKAEKDVAKRVTSIANPSSKSDYIERAKFIAQVSENDSYKYEVQTSEWQNYGKDRTYIKMNQYFQDGKFRSQMNFGYYDNVKKEYVKGGKNSDSMSGNLWNLQGSKKYTDSDIANEIKKNKK